MDKEMSVEERIKRAEDIYNRRNGIYTKSVISEKKVSDKRKKRNVKRLLMQIFVCLVIYMIFYVVTNRNYIFSEEFRNSVNTFFTEKVATSELYIKVKNNILDFFDDEDESESKINKEENIIENNINEVKQDNNDNNDVNIKTEEENIGGANENIEDNKNSDKKTKNEKVAQKKENKLTEQELMEKEAKEIKENISFIVPLNGRISSTFGWRNPTTSSVPKYHTGLDIAAIEGSVIKSATDGKVIMASSTGDYGNHYQIQIKDVILVYAHCKKLYLKEGDRVKQGQEIAEVGSTGNSTGPHLHFEIRKEGRKIDPQLVLDL